MVVVVVVVVVKVVEVVVEVVVKVKKVVDPRPLAKTLRSSRPAERFQQPLARTLPRPLMDARPFHLLQR